MVGEIIPECRAKSSRNAEHDQIGMVGDIIADSRATSTGIRTHQLFHRDQPETTETSFGEGAMQSCREAQPPRSLGAEDGRTGRPFGDLEPTELTIALASRLP